MSNPLLHRYCARVLVEATTALKIGSGEAGLTIDELVATDANGLPMIPGTAICGVLRHALTDLNAGVDVDNLFGFQKKESGEGSRLIFTSARIVGVDGLVMDGLQGIDLVSNAFYSKFKKLAIRDHCKITDKGTADVENNGKFDSQVVYKGCRFVFDIEMIGDDSDSDSWSKLLTMINSPLFRVGGGTRKGFGELAIKAISNRCYDLTTESEAYMNRSAQLDIPEGEFECSPISTNTTTYELKLVADDFFMFSLGAGDEDADNIAKKEMYIKWENEKPSFTDEKVLIPATSVKGAVSHRTAFHYNRLTKVFADQLPKGKTIADFVAEKNEAVKSLFGFAKDSDKGESYGQRGRVITSDVYVEKSSEKILNHVAIDRFTGGALDGALFDEKVTVSSEEIVLKFVVEDAAFTDTHVKEAFEATLQDITTGMLALGGSTMRGHGCFSGTLKVNGVNL